MSEGTMVSALTTLHPRSLLVLGGARSGKSGYAKNLAEASGLDGVLVATAEPGDAEMAERIQRHIADRKPGWLVIEEPHNLCRALQTHASASRALVVDCITFWLTNRMLAGADCSTELAYLTSLLPELPGTVVFVSNEVGSGIVPDNAMAREFRDLQGQANRLLAQACEAVVLVTAGLPLVLKPLVQPTIIL
jgi:adenosylcobinamide kinase / adenosylcobinamide-phosphate guanylyltransferase